MPPKKKKNKKEQKQITSTVDNTTNLSGSSSSESESSHYVPDTVHPAIPWNLTPRQLELYLLIAILGVGAILRGIYLYQIANGPTFNFPSLDAAFYDHWARGLAFGDWAIPKGAGNPNIGELVYHKFPMYPWFLTVVYKLFGPGYMAPRIIQMMLGLGSAYIAYLMSRRWFGPFVALLTATLTSTYWLFIFYEGEIYPTALFVFFLMLTMYSAALLVEKLTLKRCLITGILFGFTALTRGNVLIFAPVLAFWLAWIVYKRLDFKRVIYMCAALTIGVLLVISPITIRNYVVGDDFVLISSKGGINLLLGNNKYCDGVLPTIPNLMELTGSPTWTPFEYPKMVNGLRRKLGRPDMKYSEASAYWAGLAKKYIKEHPGRTLYMTFHKALLYWGPLEVSNPMEVHFARQHSPILRKIPGNFHMTLSLFIIGVALLIQEIRRRRRISRHNTEEDRTTRNLNEVMVLFLLFIFTYFLSILPFLVSSRYRTPILPFMFIFGGYGIYRIAQIFLAHDYKRVSRWGVAWFILFVLAGINWPNYQPDISRWYFSNGVAYGRADNFKMSRKEFAKSAAANPRFAEAHYNLGNVAFKQGKFEEAVEFYDEAIKQNAQLAAVYSNLGVTHFRLKNYKKAIINLQEALKRDPNYKPAKDNLKRVMNILKKKKIIKKVNKKKKRRRKKT